MGETNLNSGVWDDEQRAGIVSRALTRLAKRFKTTIKDNMVAGPHSGVLYKRSAGAGFNRFHRASARGERPSPDTFNLVNSVTDEKLSPTNHRIFVDDSKAPYAKYLQDPEILDRPIATLEDAEAFIETVEAQAEIDKAKAELTGTVTGETN